jgi:hypothetical protein
MWSYNPNELEDQSDFNKNTLAMKHNMEKVNKSNADRQAPVKFSISEDIEQTNNQNPNSHFTSSHNNNYDDETKNHFPILKKIWETK